VISTKRIRSTNRTKINLASRSPIRRAVRTGAARPAAAQTVALLLIASRSLKARATRQMIAALQENTAKRKIRARRIARRIASQARKTSARTRTKAKIKVKRSPRSLSEPPVPKVKSSLGVAY
jgi:hypothetical protein